PGPPLTHHEGPRPWSTSCGSEAHGPVLPAVAPRLGVTSVVVPQRAPRRTPRPGSPRAIARPMAGTMPGPRRPGTGDQSRRGPNWHAVLHHLDRPDSVIGELTRGYRFRGGHRLRRPAP